MSASLALKRTFQVSTIPSFESRRNVPHVVAEPEVAPNHVLEQAHSLSLHQLVNHVAQHSSHCIEAFVGMADVREASLVEQNLLNDEDCDGLGEFGTGFHDAEA